MKHGHKSLLDPTFKYTKAVETDLRKTFARVRRQAREADGVARLIEQADAEEAAGKVLPMLRPVRG